MSSRDICQVFVNFKQTLEFTFDSKFLYSYVKYLSRLSLIDLLNLRFWKSLLLASINSYNIFKLKLTSLQTLISLSCFSDSSNIFKVIPNNNTRPFASFFLINMPQLAAKKRMVYHSLLDNLE